MYSGNMCEIPPQGSNSAAAFRRLDLQQFLDKEIDTIPKILTNSALYDVIERTSFSLFLFSSLNNPPYSPLESLNANHRHNSDSAQSDRLMDTKQQKI